MRANHGDRLSGLADLCAPDLGFERAIWRPSLVKGGRHAVLEGDAPERHVISAFPGWQTALDRYTSADYGNVLPSSLPACPRDIVIGNGI